jgi:2-C-methyl-D-erythritol 2,4-cyclodiphosphate synthase
LPKIAGPPVRTGIGYDVHQFSPGRKLILGGVHLPSKVGLLGHSDADVLSHAICDALLGAAALGDIGTHFPDTTRKYKNRSSLLLLRSVRSLLGKAGYAIVNVDSMLILQAPKISRSVSAMRRNIASALDLHPSQVSVKATTNEMMGFIGRGEGCAALATAAIAPVPER